MNTTIRREKFEKLAQKAEKDYQDNPKKYKNTIRLLVLLGYGYLLLILTALLSVVAVSIFLAIKTHWFWLLLIKKKLIIVLIVLIYVLFKALFIKIPAPQGHRLKKTDAPHLFDQVNRLRTGIKAPKIHEIVITPEFNAAIQQTPRLGLIGWQKNSLILGLPLLMTLNDKQTLAVIAHEMGHLAGNHSKFNGWIYRSRTSWLHIAMSLGQLSGVADWLFGRFMNWYAPYFSAYTFALARANEYEADDIAGQLTDPHDLSQALTKTHVLPALTIDRYWQKLERQAYNQEHIEQQSFTKLLQSLQQTVLNGDEISSMIEQGMRQKTNFTNTHPSLSDRLENLQVKPQWHHDINQSAFNTWFDNTMDDVLKRFDQQWRDDNQQQWQQLYEQGQSALKRLDTLQDQLEQNQADPKQLTEQLAEQAQITHVLYGSAKADPLYQRLFDIDDKQPEACLYFGSKMINKGDEKGIELLIPLMKQQSFIMVAGEYLYEYFTASEQHEKAKKVLENMEKKQDLDDHFYQEINSLSETDQLHKDDLTDEEYGEICQQLVQQEMVAHVWIAQKALVSYPEQRMHIIIYQITHQGQDQEQAWYDWLEHKWPIKSTYLAINNKQHKALAKHVIKSARKVK